jgi:hypothetical protein
MAPLIGAVASCRWNWAMSRTECCAGVGQTRYQTASLERYMKWSDLIQFQAPVLLMQFVLNPSELLF